MITFYGNATPETITGSGNDDILYGGGDNDTITGLAGDDVIHGDTQVGGFTPGAEILVTPNSPLWQTTSSIAGGANGGFLVAYMSSPVSGHPSLAAQRNDQIIGRIYDAASNAVTGEFAINGAQVGNQNSASVARLSDGNFIVVWADESGLDGSGGGIRAQRVSPTGTLIGSQFTVNQGTAHNQSDPEVTALPNGRFAVSFTTLHQPGGHTFDTAVRTFANNGTAPSTEIIVNAPSDITGYQWDSSVTAVGTSGEFVVAYQSFSDYTFSAGTLGYRGDVYLQRFNAAGTASGAPFVAHAPHAEHDGHPVVTALANGTVVVAWQTFDADANEADVVFDLFPTGSTTPNVSVQANSYAASYQNAPDITALVGGGFVMVWQSFQQDGDNNGIYAQRFSDTGAAVGPEIMVHATVTAQQMYPSVTATSNGGFAVSWDSGEYDLLQPNGMGTIRARIFDPSTTTSIPGNDVLSGGAGNDSILGQGGNDSLTGDAGNDSLDGGSGNDRLDGGTGNDDLRGQGGIDSLIGGLGDDVLQGHAGNDSLTGGIGNDRINGGTGSDNMSGHAGDDTLVGSAGADSLLGGAGNDTLAGGAGADLLSGGAGDDVMNGGAGSDNLTGGMGMDKMSGNAGPDVFIFNSEFESAVGAARDQIIGFQSGLDRIVLTGIDADTNTVPDDAFLNQPFLSSFSGQAGELVYVGSILSGDVDGDGAADFEISVIGLTINDIAL